ncbi:MAG: hypothetical protein NTW87_05240 [Planctomycetota bacterium]|nr:hypothetical protein [Planctomycetota bacterium]
MSTLSDEALAGIRLLVCMAMADGVLKPDERYALEDAVAGEPLPEGLTLNKLLAERNDPLALAKMVQKPETRAYTYASLYSLAYCDRELAESENRLLAMLRTEWGVAADEQRSLEKALDITEHMTGPLPAAVKDVVARKEQLGRLLLRYSILAGLTGAIPVPLVPDLMVVPMQVKMVYDIAALCGHKADKGTIQLMFETLGVGTGARLGVSILCKLVPGWGSLVGAASSFATTYALGKVAGAYYESEGKRSFESLQPMFRAEQENGKQEFKKHRAALDEARRAHAGTLKQMAYDLQQGKITPEQYAEKVDTLS